MGSILLHEFTTAHLAAIEGWFADAETRRWLGDESWPRRLLLLAAASADRLAFVAMRDSTAVGLVDVERTIGARADLALVVSPPHRRLGVGRAIVKALPQQPALSDVVEFIGGVETGNDASRALVIAAGFQQVTGPDNQGFTYFALQTGGAPATQPSLLAPS